MNELDTATVTPDKQLEGLVAIEHVGSLRIEIPPRTANPGATALGFVSGFLGALPLLFIFLGSGPDSAMDILLGVLPVALGVLPLLWIWFGRRVIELDAVTLWTCSQILGIGSSRTLTIEDIKNLRVEKDTGPFASTSEKEDSEDTAAGKQVQFAVVCEYQGKPRKLARFVSEAVGERIIDLILDRHPELAPEEKKREEECRSP